MNGVRCPRCGNPVNPTVAQCPNCGLPLRAAATAATTVASATLATSALKNAYDDQRKKNLRIAAIVGGIALILAVAFGLKWSGALSASGSNPNDQLLNVSGHNGPNVLVAPGKSGGDIMNKDATVTPDAKMPDDVYAWLKHLEKCEAMKVEISGNQAAEVSVWIQKSSALGAGMGLMDPYDQASGDDKDQDPGSYTKGKMLDLRPEWEKLGTFFRSVPPPAECQPLADDFDRSISQIPAMMGDIGELLNSAATDPQGAMQKVKKMQNGSYAEIDRYFERCDQKLTGICDKYHTHKWFNIKSDVMAGGMMGKFSTSTPSAGF